MIEAFGWACAACGATLVAVDPPTWDCGYCGCARFGIVVHPIILDISRRAKRRT